MTSTEQQELLFRCGKVFSPATPISTRDLFAGRNEQIRQAGQAVHTRGQHAVIFGERGVGKTSLANILKVLLGSENTLVVKINCHQDDTFQKIWLNALSEIEITENVAAGFNREPATRRSSPAEAIDASSGPDDIRRTLQGLGRSLDTVLIFDEFDRLHGSQAQRLFADTIKNLSDNAINSTFVIVGVANDVSGLIAEHASIDRSLVQIQMPRMQPGELKEIVNKAMHELGMTIQDDALELIVMLSQGLPHYTHLVGQEAAITAINDRRNEIALPDVKGGVNVALKNTQHSILDAYQKATKGQRKGTLFKQVLLACAIAEVDEQGYFISAAVREPLTKIMGKPYDIPNFSQHLDKFSSDQARGPVLERAGTARRFRFRFINPLLQPYVIMRGLSDELLDGDVLELLRRKQQSRY
ncbi:MAG: nSTAND1 domain-containing NTPase [Gemmataceae bacterium]